MDRLIASRRRFCTVAAAITMAVYAKACSGDFQFDDFHSILDNPHLKDWRTFIGHLEHMVRPVLYATFFVDRSLYGNEATGYHALNLLLHLVSGFLIYRVLCAAVTDDFRHVPFWTALLFLIHPIQTEAVTYISGRASGLMAFFYLLGLYLYIEGTAPQHDSTTCRVYVTGAWLSFVLALGSKETAVTFPVALFLWDAVVRRYAPGQLRTAVVSRHLPFWLTLFVVGGWAWGHPRYAALAQFSVDLRPLGTNVLSELHAGLYGAWLLFAPWEQSFDHDLPVLRSWSEWPVPLDFTLLVGMAAAAWLAARRQPLVFFGLAWYWLQLSPLILIPRNDLLSERNLYLASIGLLLACVALAAGCVHALTKAFPQRVTLRPAAGIVAAVVVLALCLATAQRNRLYHDPFLLWSDAVAKGPQKARPHNNLGHVYAERGNWEQAIVHFRMAAQLDAEYVDAQNNLRDAYLHTVGRR